MKKNILIVDDDNRNTFALSAILRARGYHCVVAGSAREAFGLLKDHEPVHIILMDMMMPEMDGYEAIPVLKLNEQYKDIPVVAVTAQAMTGDKAKCIAAGADDYLSKPVNVDLLQELLNKYIP